MATVLQLVTDHGLRLTLEKNGWDSRRHGSCGCQVAKPDHPSNPGRDRMTPKDAGEAMIPIGVGKEPAESKAPSHADKPSK